ncbi:hypothetical protein V2J09_010822 [Rumex salicifolius]
MGVRLHRTSYSTGAASSLLHSSVCTSLPHGPHLKTTSPDRQPRPPPLFAPRSPPCCRTALKKTTPPLVHLNSLVANRVVALPVVAPPGHWIGAGWWMIMESDKFTEIVRKHYIGMVTMLDILAHISGDDVEQMDNGDVVSHLDDKLAAPVSSIIGHCLEGLSLWTLNPNTRKSSYLNASLKVRKK